MKAHKYSLPKIPPRLTAFLLFLSMLLSVFAVFPSYATTAEDETITENTVSNLEPVETEDQIFDRLTADSLMLNYIDETAFRAAGHVNRLPEEEDLNSYVFDNEDGTRTAYILAEPVKYVDSTGEIREKNLTLSQGLTPNASVMANDVNTGAYTVTATNTPMIFPNDLSQGVRFTYGEYTITLRPETISTSTTILQADGKVLYRNAFGSTAHLMYTPQLNGLKEDIVLTKYTDQNTFSFILDTDGLIPASDAGGYYLWDGIDPEMKIRLGQVVSYDAEGDFSDGSMTLECISDTTYRITVIVDPTFLTDLNTAYPVTIDPSLTVSDNVTGANSIVDAPVFSGYSTRNYANYQFNSIGYVSSSYGVAQTLVKFPGFYEESDESSFYNQLNSEDIISAIFTVREASGSAPASIHIYKKATVWEVDDCANTCGTHHKNVSYIQKCLSSEISRDFNNVVVMWTNRDPGTYCDILKDEAHVLRDTQLGATDPPVILIMRLYESEFASETVNENNKWAGMALCLLHETMHILGLDDKEDNNHKNNMDVNDTVCIMRSMEQFYRYNETEELLSTNAHETGIYDYYQSLLTLDPDIPLLCDDCAESLNLNRTIDEYTAPSV